MVHVALASWACARPWSGAQHSAAPRPGIATLRNGTRLRSPGMVVVASAQEGRGPSPAINKPLITPYATASHSPDTPRAACATPEALPSHSPRYVHFISLARCDIPCHERNTMDDDEERDFDTPFVCGINQDRSFVRRSLREMTPADVIAAVKWHHSVAQRLSDEESQWDKRPAVTLQEKEAREKASTATSNAWSRERDLRDLIEDAMPEWVPIWEHPVHLEEALNKFWPFKKAPSPPPARRYKGD